MTGLKLILYSMAALVALTLGLMIGTTGMVDSTFALIWVAVCLVLLAVLIPLDRKIKKAKN